MKERQPLTLNHVLLRLVILRLLLPLLILSLIAIGGVGYLGKQSLDIQQQQKAQSVAQMVDHYLDQAGRTIDAVARVVEISTPKDSTIFMKSTWEAYRYFDTIYYLDKSSKIKLLVPYDPSYLDLDMSNLSYIHPVGENIRLIISRPFISLRTGNPTVYLIRYLTQGRYIVGELNLGLLQDEITHEKSDPSKGYSFIMDQYGVLIAHPSSDLVKQQANFGHLKIFECGLHGDATLIYQYNGNKVLGSAVRVKRVGWVVVTQIPLSMALGPYVWTLGLILLASIFVGLGLMWNLRKQLQRDVVNPLVQLSKGTTALAIGDYSQVNALALISATFIELDRLAKDFLHMSNALKARQTALTESEERLRLALATAKQGIYDLDLRTGEAITSPEHAIMLGFDPADFHETYQQWLKRIHSDDRDSVDNKFTAYLRGEISDYNVESRQITLDGEWKWILSTGKIIEWDSDGNPVRMVGINTDITERKITEDALRKEKAFTDAVLDSVPGLLYLYSDQRQLIRWNKKHSEMTGYSAEELTNFSLQNWFKGEDAVRIEKAVDKVFDEGYVDVDANLVTKSGSTIFFAFTGLRATIDNKPYLVGIGIDITERKKAEDDLALSNNELKAINRLISETTAVADLKSILEASMDESLNILGLEGGTICLLGSDNVLELAVHRSTSNETIADIKSGNIKVGDCLCGMCAKTGQPLILTNKEEVLSFATREVLRGENILFHAAFPLMVESRCLGVLCIFTRTEKKPTERSLKLLETVTKQIAQAIERARLFEEVKRNAEELELRVRERTMQLESANKELEAFGYSVSHDLRAPLRAIDGFSLIVEENYSDKLDEDGKEYLNRIRMAAVKMGRLIDDILRLSRITRAEMIRGKVDLSEMVKSIAHDLTETQPERSVDLVIEPGLVAEADANLIKIALENLLGNAFKFTSKNEIARIEFGMIRENGKNVYFVRDNGAGFNQDYAGKLFGAFQRLHSDSQFPGTGVGLATVKRIIHMHEGEVWAEGEVGKGATFYFTLKGGA